MSKGRLKSASKAVVLIPILKSSLGVVDCWLASLLDQANAVELMGKSESLLFFCIFSFLCHLILLPHHFFPYQIHLGRKRTGVLYEEDPEEERQGCWCCCLSSLLVMQSLVFLWLVLVYTLVFCLDGPTFVLTNATLKIFLGMN